MLPVVVVVDVFMVVVCVAWILSFGRLFVSKDIGRIAKWKRWFV